MIAPHHAPDDAPPPALTCYCGWGYAPGPRGAVVHVYETADGRVLGVEGARLQAEADEDGRVYEEPEWDRAGWLPDAAREVRWPPPNDLDCARDPLTDDERDAYYDEIRDALPEVLRD